jgi:hypothetical protein
MLSVTCLIKLSLMLQPNVFQVFQPIGGVRATPFSSALAGHCTAIRPPASNNASPARAAAAARYRVEPLIGLLV